MEDFIRAVCDGKASGANEAPLFLVKDDLNVCGGHAVFVKVLHAIFIT